MSDAVCLHCCALALSLDVPSRIRSDPVRSDPVRSDATSDALTSHAGVLLLCGSFACRDALANGGEQAADSSGNRVAAHISDGRAIDCCRPGLRVCFAIAANESIKRDLNCQTASQVAHSTPTPMPMPADQAGRAPSSPASLARVILSGEARRDRSPAHNNERSLSPVLLLQFPASHGTTGRPTQQWAAAAAASRSLDARSPR